MPKHRARGYSRCGKNYSNYSAPRVWRSSHNLLCTQHHNILRQVNSKFCMFRSKFILYVSVRTWITSNTLFRLLRYQPTIVLLSIIIYNDTWSAGERADSGSDKLFNGIYSLRLHTGLPVIVKEIGNYSPGRKARRFDPQSQTPLPFPHETQNQVTLIFHPSSWFFFSKIIICIIPIFLSIFQATTFTEFPLPNSVCVFDSPNQHIPNFCNSLCTPSTLLCLKTNSSVIHVVTTTTNCGSSSAPKQRTFVRFQASATVYPTP